VINSHDKYLGLCANLVCVLYMVNSKNCLVFGSELLKHLPLDQWESSVKETFRVVFSFSHSVYALDVLFCACSGGIVEVILR